MRLLVDSDFLFGLFVPDDAHHQRAKKIWGKLIKQKHDFFVLNITIQETATVLSHKRGQLVAIALIDKLPELALRKIDIDIDLEKEGWKIFKSQTKKGTSFVDCANLAASAEFGIDEILSFDKFYPKKLLIR